MRIVVSFFVFLLVGACDAGIAIPVPDVAKGGRYFGTSLQDLWVAPPLHRWDGSAWTPVQPAVDISNGQFRSASEGKLWFLSFSTPAQLFRISADGSVEDFSEKLPPTLESSRQIASRGELLLFLTSATPDLSKAYLLEGGEFRELPDPPLAGFGSEVRFAAADDIWLDAPPSGDELEGRDLHFDGTQWTLMESGGVSQTGNRWPTDDIWMSCAAGPRHFDGTRYTPLVVELPDRTGCSFFYAASGPSMTYSTAQGIGSTPEAYACDVDGNCSLLDVPGEREMELRRADWNGTAWVNDQAVTRYKICVGAGCGLATFVTEPRLFPELDDGTQVFFSENTSGDAQLHLITP